MDNTLVHGRASGSLYVALHKRVLVGSVERIRALYPPAGVKRAFGGVRRLPLLAAFGRARE